MKERRGTVGRLTGIAESVAAAARRRQRDREPRILVYDRSGHPRLVPPGAPGYDEAVLAADRLVELTGAATVRAGRRARDGAAAPQEEPVPVDEAGAEAEAQAAEMLEEIVPEAPAGRRRRR